MMQNQDSRPIPDPTTLTTLQLVRELAHTEQLLRSEQQGLKEYLETEIRAIRQQMSDVKEYRDNKFKDIERQFAERDSRIQQAAIEARQAVTDAFKSVEASTTEFKQGNTKVIDLLTARVDDLRDSKATIKGQTEGGDKTWQAISLGLGILVTLVTLGGVALAIAQ
jgi:hypothetical protein